MEEEEEDKAVSTCRASDGPGLLWNVKEAAPRTEAEATEGVPQRAHHKRAATTRPCGALRMENNKN